MGTEDEDLAWTKSPLVRPSRRSASRAEGMARNLLHRYDSLDGVLEYVQQQVEKGNMSPTLALTIESAARKKFLENKQSADTKYSKIADALCKKHGNDLYAIGQEIKLSYAWPEPAISIGKMIHARLAMQAQTVERSASSVLLSEVTPSGVGFFPMAATSTYHGESKEPLLVRSQMEQDSNRAPSPSPKPKI